MRFLPWTVAAFVAHVPPENPPVTVVEHIALPLKNPTETSVFSAPTNNNAMLTGIRQFLVPSANAATPDAAPPSPKDIKLLQDAMASFYGVDRDLTKSSELLSQAIEVWKGQPADERAALYRVRADCYMGLLEPQKAEQDYAVAMDLLQGPGGDLADPEELPAAALGRGRAIRSQREVFSKERAGKSASYYELSLELSSREDWDTKQERLEDGATRNPYATWEFASCLRSAGDLERAAETHALAGQAFEDIGDRARSVISKLDAGIDLAGVSGKADEAKSILSKAIQKTTLVEGRDVDLLQRVIAKEGEGRLALASLLWEDKDRSGAETQLGDACIRLEQLEADTQARNAKLGELAKKPAQLKFSIDNIAGPFEVSCSKFRNEQFLTETLQWPASLQSKVLKLQNLGK